MGIIRRSRSRRLRPRCCPPHNQYLSPRHGPVLGFLTGGPAPPGLLTGPPVPVPAPPPVVPGPSSLMRQNYHPECEAAVNRQINLELQASYAYLAMALFFDRYKMAMEQNATFFLRQSNEKREQALMLMRLQNQRGGRIRLRGIGRPDRCHWESSRRAMKHALQVETIVNQNLLSLFSLANDKDDVHLCDFLEHLFLRQCVKLIENFAASILTLRRMGAPQSGLAEYLFGKLSLDDSKN